tara:strand:- start:164 stop:670 length:507 start_codon:yes stop_codon:yes gene_type:complete
MATTTFTGIVRSNGNGKKTTYAGSMQMVAQFYVPSTNAAAGTDAQISATDTRQVKLPKGAIIDSLSFKGAAAAGGKLDVGYADLVDGTTFVDTDGLADNLAADATQGNIQPGAATDGASLGVIEMTHDVKIVAGVAAAGQAGTLSGTLFYHMVDDGEESNSGTDGLTA